MVYVLDSSNRVHIRSVQVGIEGSKLAEIKSGLQPGDHVILGGQDKYQDGETVDPAVSQQPASETQQETGGTIDLRADAQSSDTAGSDPSSSVVAEKEHRAGLSAQRENNAIEPGAKKQGARGQGAKHVGGGAR